MSKEKTREFFINLSKYIDFGAQLIAVLAIARLQDEIAKIQDTE